MDNYINYEAKGWRILCENDHFSALLDFEYTIKKHPRRIFKGQFKLEEDWGTLPFYWKNKWYFENENFNKESLQDDIVIKEKDSLYEMKKIPLTFHFLNINRFEVKEIYAKAFSEQEYELELEIPEFNNNKFNNNRIFIPETEYEISFITKIENGELTDLRLKIIHKTRFDYTVSKINFVINKDLKESNFCQQIIQFCKTKTA